MQINMYIHRVNFLKQQFLCGQQWQTQIALAPEKVIGCSVHHQGVFLFSDSSPVLSINRLINCTSCNSIKASVMVYKVWNCIDPSGDPQSLDN